MVADLVDQHVADDVGEVFMSYGQKLVTGLRVKAAYRGGDRASTSPTKE